MSLKCAEVLHAIAVKNDVKFEEELTCRFKIDWGTWRILTRALESLKKLHFTLQFQIIGRGLNKTGEEVVQYLT